MSINRHTLGSIPEKEEDDWVPKNKHDVLKAKYKCLKKLFQIYDATMTNTPLEAEITSPRRRRKKRSHRSKSDAVVGTSETALTRLEDDVQKITYQKSFTYASTQHSYCCLPRDSTQSFSYKADETLKRASSLGTGTLRRRRLSRLRVFLARLFGRQHCTQSECPERRRRRGLRFRRVKLTHVRSEPTVAVLSRVQSAQRSCLADSTRRQCPFVSCHAKFNGIINYNDHLNICHFPERTHVCHYCHEGYTSKTDRTLHENQHLGITKTLPEGHSETLCRGHSPPSSPEDKRKKIVSFFDRKLDRPNRDNVSETTFYKGVTHRESQEKLLCKSCGDNNGDNRRQHKQCREREREKENVDLVSKHGSIQVNCENHSLYAMSENSLTVKDYKERYSAQKGRSYNYKWEPGQ